MVEVIELFNKINNLESRCQTESQPRQSRQLTGTPRNDSIDHLGSKVLILKDNSINSAISASALSSLQDEVSPLDGTALARQLISALSGLETSQLGPTMTGPTKTEERRGLKSHGRVQGPHRRDREFPEPRRGESE